MNVRVAALLIAAVASGQALSCAPRGSPRRFALATTTSVDNSGLLGVLLPAFRSQTGVEVRLTTPGSGIALKMLADGSVDAVISHAPAREAEVLGGGGWFYRKIMFNDFVLAGPRGDPAHVKDARTPEDAMRRIHAAGARFISRGDSSGTHERERVLWARAGVVPDPQRVVASGGGMGATLRVAATMGAYTLTDRATWDQHAGGDLIVVFEGGADLLNTYAVIVRRGAAPETRMFAEWLADGEGRRLIAAYRTAAGAPAFTVWPAGCPRESPGDMPCAGGTAQPRT